MLHHISLPVSDLAASSRLYDAVLGALGYARVWSTNDAVGYGISGGEDLLAIKQVNPAIAAGIGFHVAFSASSDKAVERFYEAALKCGATDNGRPGLRPDYGQNYYSAFIIDLDSHRIEAVHNPSPEAESVGRTVRGLDIAT